jgi:tetratricopeptide (TPR) repeat protein
MSPSLVARLNVGRIIFTLVGLSFLAASCFGQQAGSSGSAQIPQQALTAFSKGLVASQKKDWMSAVNYFDQARQAAPDAPPILYELAVAESYVPGRELRALAWFDAYLAANLSASNLDEIDSRTADLQGRYARSISQLAELALHLALQIPEAPAVLQRGGRHKRDRVDALRKLMSVLLQFGDFVDARKVAEADHRYYVDLGTAEEKADSSKSVNDALADLVSGRDTEETSEGWLSPSSITLRTESEIAVVEAKLGKLDLAEKELAWVHDKEVKSCPVRFGAPLNPDGSITPPPTVLTPEMVTGTNGCLDTGQFEPTARALVAIAGAEYGQGDSARRLVESYLPENFTRGCAGDFLNVPHYYIPREDFHEALDITSDAIRRGCYFLDWGDPVHELALALLAKGDSTSALKLANLRYNDDYGVMGTIAAWKLSHGDIWGALSICQSNRNLASTSTCRIASWSQQESSKKGSAYQVAVLTDFINGRLNSILFTDFQGAIRSIANGSDAWQIFEGVVAALSDVGEKDRERDCVGSSIFLTYYGPSDYRACAIWHQ